MRGEGQGEGQSVRGPRARQTNRARSLRQSENNAEAVLWGELRGRRLNGLKFVRQFPLGPYFADFACREHSLVVELDGSQHAGNVYDEKRNQFMLSVGWSVLRFWNTAVLDRRDFLLNTIVEICEGRLTGNSVGAEMTFLSAYTGSGTYEPSA